MTDFDPADQPDLAEVLASIRRMTALERGEHVPEPFELPAVFRPNSPSPPEAPRLVNKLSELLRRTAVPPPPVQTAGFVASAAVSHDGSGGVGDVSGFVSGGWAAARAGVPGQQSPQARSSAVPAFSASPRYRVMLAEHAVKQLSDDDVRRLVGELLWVATTRLSSGASAPPAERNFHRAAQPTVAASNSGLEALVGQLLRPMLQEWLVENMTGTLERAVASELRRIMGLADRPVSAAPGSPMSPRHSAGRYDPTFGSR